MAADYSRIPSKFIIVPCPRAYEKSFTPGQSLEENQKELFQNLVLRDPKIEVLEVRGMNCKRETGNCMWMVKFRHSFQIEDFIDLGMYNHLYSVLEQCKPLNLNIFVMAALPGAEENGEFFITYEVKCTCTCLNFLTKQQDK